ncbi:hypothetical protein H6G41_15040 [Tolypothrix sp. FACHB-123]|uniref:hypothetical protein n=1 Tax=Tolypothrix sp. FACHB-123 TaxID=2692868 RepID=UPI00168665A9|nr:hypothetical protein [Tolypothrix sp. FACHB-123]MBD2355919.1 hypothetical protein [Tolypothrix sp. FACHB-123]
MANLEKLLHELTKLVESLKLTVGDSHAIKQEIIRLSFIQEKLRNLQSAIAEELVVTKINSPPASVLSTSTESPLLTSNSCFVAPLLTTGEKFIAEKFSNGSGNISLNDLDAKISRWLEWGELLQTIAEDILSNSQFINQLSFNINYPSLSSQFQELEAKLKIDLAYGKSRILHQQHQQIINAQEELLQVQQRSTEVFENIKNTQNILLILLNLSAFCGNSGLELEWFDDEYGFIISSAGNCQALGDIIYDCESFQGKIHDLVLETKILLDQSETALNNLPQRPTLSELGQLIAAKPVHSFFAIGASLLILGFGTWTVTNQIIHIQHQQKLKQEKTSLSNLKSAQKLGMEAATLVQKTPLPLKDWQQAQEKWQKAVKLLESAPKDTSVSVKVQGQLVKYRSNYTTISKRVDLEKNAASKLETADKLAQEAAFIVKNAPQEAVILQQAKDKLKEAINLLQTIPAGTFVSPQVQEKLATYQQNYEKIK